MAVVVRYVEAAAPWIRHDARCEVVHAAPSEAYEAGVVVDIIAGWREQVVYVPVFVVRWLEAAGYPVNVI